MSTAVVAEDSTAFTLKNMKKLLKSTEGLTERLFELDGSAVFKYSETAEKPFTVKFGEESFGITEAAAYKAFAQARIPVSMVEAYDLELLTPLLNWWFENAGGELKALVKDKTVVEFVRAGTDLYDVGEMFNEILRAVKSHGIDEDTLRFYKVHHDLNETQFSLVLTKKTRALENGDIILSGIQVQHSITGLKPTIISAYTSRSHHDNGHISGTLFDQWNRKLGKKAADATFAKDDTDEMAGYDVYTWCFDTADSVVRGFKHEVASIEALREVSVGSHAGTFFNDVFTKYGIPTSLRKLVREEYADQLGQTIYDLWNAVTLVSDREEVEGHTSNIRKMMEVGGELAMHPHQCPHCHRMKEDAA